MPETDGNSNSNSSSAAGTPVKPTTATGSSGGAEGAEDAANTESDSVGSVQRSLSKELSSTDPTAATEDDEKMKRFLSSSIVAIPWTYEGHHHTPETYAEELVGSQLSAEEKEQLIKTAEEEAIIFASTVCDLAEFISSLPEGTVELKLCFSCTDRLVRDALTLGIRSLAAQPNGCTRYERSRVFPWLSAEEADGAALRGEAAEASNNGGGALVGESNESDQDVKRRLRTVEEENAALKRERNELSSKLLDSREEVVQLKNQMQSGSGGKGLHTGGSSYNLKEDITASASTAAGGDGSGGGLTAADLDGDKLEQFKQLSRQVIELENKLELSNKREGEATKIRADIEARNNRLVTDVEKYKKGAEEASRKLASVQALYDRQMSAMQRLEDDQVTSKNEIDALQLKLREMNALKATLVQKDSDISELKQQLTEKDAEVKAGKVQQSSLQNHIESLTSESNNRAKEYEAKIAELQTKLENAESQNKKLESDLSDRNDRITTLESELTEAKKLEGEVREAKARADRLNGELNHLQQKVESQTRDMKKTMKDNAMSLAEFEKALIRKSEECNDLYFKINAMKDAEAARNAESSNNSGSGAGASIFSKLNALRRESLGGGVSGVSTHDNSATAAGGIENDSSGNSSANTETSSSSSGGGGLMGMFRKNSVA